MAGSNGSGTIDDTALHQDQKIKAFQAQEDTVIDTLSGVDSKGNAYDFKLSKNIVTVKAGGFHTAKDGYLITNVKLTSGSIIFYE